MSAYLILTSGQQLADLPDLDVDVFEEAALSLDALLARRLVQALPEPERAVIAWRFGIGRQPLGHREIARLLGVSVGTAWNIERRGLGQLRRLLEDGPRRADVCARSGGGDAAERLAASKDCE